MRKNANMRNLFADSFDKKNKKHFASNISVIRMRKNKSTKYLTEKKKQTQS